MAGNDNFDVPQDFKQVLRRQEKRQQRQERRTPGAAGAVVSNEGLAERVFQGSTEQPLVSSAIIMPDPNWSIDSQSGFSHRESYGTLVQWSMTVSRIGPPITVGPTGNIANNPIGTLRVGWVPVTTMPVGSGATGRLAAFVIGTGGVVFLAALSAGAADVTTGEQFSLGGSYIAVSAVE